MPGCRLPESTGRRDWRRCRRAARLRAGRRGGLRRCGRRPGLRLRRLASFSRTLPERYSSAVCQRLRFRVVVDQVAQLGDDRLLGLAVERGDVAADRPSPRAVERDQQAFLGGGDVRDGGLLPTTSRSRIGALAALPVTSSYSSSAMTSMASGSSRNLTRFGMRRMTVPSVVSRERGLVDRAVGGDEAVVGAIQFAAGVLAVAVRPAFVLATAGRGGRGRAGRPGRRAACRSWCRRP